MVAFRVAEQQPPGGNNTSGGCKTGGEIDFGSIGFPQGTKKHPPKTFI